MAAQLFPILLVRFQRELGPPGSAEVLAAADAEASLAVDLTVAHRPTNREELRRVPLPDAWRETSAKRRAPRSVLVFVDGKAVPFSYTEPLEWPADEGPTLAYYLSPRRGALIVRCGPTFVCSQALVVRDSVLLELRVYGRRLLLNPTWAGASLVAPMLCIVLGSLGIRAWRMSIGMAAATSAIATALWLGLGLFTDTRAPLWFLLQAAALTLPMGARFLRTRIGATWEAAHTEVRSPRRTMSRALLLLGTAVVGAIPHIWLARSWAPSGSDDLFYLFTSSRFLRTGSLFAGLADRSAWVYSAYPAVVASIAKGTGRHPATVYHAASYAGAILLPLGLGLLAWGHSGRLSTAMAASWIAGTWGGLAGYVWLASRALPALLAGRLPSLIESDYYSTEFFGEYAGPHSEITAYLCDPPFYPREVGLLLFWLALATVLWRRNSLALMAAGGLALTSFAVYPYYGSSIVILVAALSAAPAAELLRRQSWLLVGAVIAALSAIVLGMLGLADRFVVHYLDPSGLLAYLFHLWNGSAVPPPSPPLEFRLSRLLSGHAFSVAVVGVATWGRLGLAQEVPRLRGLARGLSVGGLVLAIGSGVLAGVDVRAARLLSVFRWIVPWRTLVEPFIVVLTALALEQCLRVLWRTKRRALAVGLALLPCLSPLHWTLNSWHYRDGTHGVGSAEPRALYDEFAEYGEQVLGRVRLREPLLVAAKPLVLSDYAQAAFGVTVVNSMRASASAPWPGRAAAFEPPWDEAAVRGASERGELGDVMVLAESEWGRRLKGSSAWREVARLGRFVILRPPQATAIQP